MNDDMRFHVGKRWKNEKCINEKGNFSNLDTAINNCPKGYNVYDDNGQIVYSRKNKKALIYTLIFLAFAIISIGTAYSYFIRNTINISFSKTHVMQNGTIIRYGGTLIGPYEDGTVIIPKGGAKIILTNAKEFTVPEGTIIKPGGTIIVPEEGAKSTIDKHGNVIVENGGAKIIDGKGNEKEVSVGTIITPDESIVESTEKEKPTINEDGSINIPPGGIVTDLDGKETEYPDGGNYIPLPPKLSDATLELLAIEGYALIPDFDPNIKTYTLTTANSVTEINIIAIANNEKATVVGDGLKNINVGINTFSIMVTAENGTKNFYTITVTRSSKEAEDTNLIVMFEGGPSITAENIVPGTIIGTKTFSINYIGTASGTGPTTIKYGILWADVINTFERTEDLVVTIKRNKSVIVNKQPLPTLSTTMFSDVILTKNKTHNYELILEYLNPGINQNIDQNKKFHTEIKIILNERYE